VDSVVAFALAVVLALVATPVAARVARRLGVVDHPGHLKVHERPVPYLGGVAVFIAMAPVIAIEEPMWLIPLGGALLLGVVDDVRLIPARIRLLCEAIIGVAAGLVLEHDTVFGVLATAAIVVALINAVNLLDGLDGLAAGVGLVSAIGLALLGGTGAIPIALAGALAGFLVFNRPPARIYLGDGGAYLIGATLAMLVAYALQENRGASYWLSALLLVAVPVTDTAIAIVRRMRSRRPVFTGDRSHVYDQLVDRGRSPGRAVAICIALQSVLVVAALVLWNLPDAIATLLAATLITGLAALVYVAGFVSPGSEQ
jgi:UDP-GlcNAc:undecaprenyl-phosphate GlcNAc-1-phosphate transferase